MADSKPIIIATALRGLDERWDPPATEAGGISAAVAQDLWYNPNGGWESAGGYQRIIRGPSNGEGGYINPFASSGAIESIHFFSQHNGSRRWLIYIDGAGGLYQFNPSTAARSGSPGDQAEDRDGNTIAMSVVSNPWIRSQSACWGDVFYLVNGIDRALVFDGYCWDYAGFSGLTGVPTATAMQHPHADDQGSSPDNYKIPNVGLGPTSDVADTNYKFARKYRISYVNNRGAESPLSASSETIYFENLGGTSVSCGAHFGRVTLPIGDSSVVARVLYATQNLYDSSSTLVTGRDAQYFYHSTIEDNVTDTIEDSLDDGFLGALVDPDSLGPWPTNAKILSPFKGRMYATDATSSTVQYSRRGSPEVWPINNVIDVGDAHLGPITAMYATRNALVVAKARGLYLIKDDGVNEPVAETLTRQTGWIAQNTVKEIPGLGIIGLSDDGVMLLKGTLQNEGVETQVFNTAVGLPTTFKRINRAAILNACATVYHRDKEYWLNIPMLGARNNSLTLVFHYEIREWSTRPYFPVSSMLETPEAAGNLLFASYAATSGVSPDGVAHLGIFVYTRAAPDKDGTAITPVYQSNPVSIAANYRTFKPLHALIDGIMHGNNALTLTGYPNYSNVAIFREPKEQIQQYPQELLPVYGVSGTGSPATFDSGYLWVAYHPGTMRFDLYEALRQPVFAFSIRMTPKSGFRYMTLLGFSLEAQPGDPIGTKPLKPDGA